jgi:hypothetical protein
MADYFPLISRAVAGLDKNTGEARRALYERARNALVAQLRGVAPALSESEITRERLALEEAIRKVETESIRQARVDLKSATSPLREAPPAETAETAPPAAGGNGGEQAIAPPEDTGRGNGSPVAATEGAQELAEAEADQGAVLQPFERGAAQAAPSQAPAVARNGTLTAEGLKGFREAVAGTSPPPGHDDLASAPGTTEERLAEPPRATPALRHPQPSEAETAASSQPSHEPLAFEFEEGPPRRLRSYEGMVRAGLIIVALAVVVGLGAVVYRERANIAALYQAMRGEPAQTEKDTAQQRPKITDRVPSAAQPGQAPARPEQQRQAGPAVAQRVVLYEEDPNNPDGKRFAGSVVWRTETISPGAGQPPEPVIRADVEVPERKIAMTFSLRRNTDKNLPASHTIEILFNLPADFPQGGVANLPGILMKQAEQTRGAPLAGLAVKVTTGFFLIGLSAVASDVQHNLGLLKERSWFDIPIVYNNGSRAILAMEKGNPGDRVFQEAFAAWVK